MSYITVWNHGSAAQKRPVQFTVPLALGWGDHLSIGPENLIASKQYDDGIHSLYVCPPPTNGWPAASGKDETDPYGTPTDYTINETSGVPDPQYAFKFAEPFAADFLCGDYQSPDFIVKPRMVVYPNSGTTGAITVQLGSLHPWTQGVDMRTGDFVPNGGDRHRWFAAEGHAEGWHVWLYVGFDAESAIAEFDAFVTYSDETASDYNTPCNRISLIWGERVSVKKRFPPETATISGPNDNVYTMSSTFNNIPTSRQSGWDHASWSGTFYGQHGWGFHGFLLAHPESGETPAEDTAEFTAAASLHAALDAETWDGHWLGGGSSGHGITLQFERQTVPEWDATGDHFFSWIRTGFSLDSVGNGGCVMSIRPRNTGGQPGFGMVRGHDVLVREVSPRDYEVGAYDVVRRPHYCWRSSRISRDPAEYFDYPGAIVQPDDLPLIEQFNGYILTDAASLAAFGKTSSSGRDGRPYIPTVATRGGRNEEFHWGDQHNSYACGPAAFALMKRPAIWHNLCLAIHYDELNGRRPDRGVGSDLTGSRAIGRRLGRLAGIWESCPGLQIRIATLIYHSEWGYYPCMKKLTGGSGLHLIELIDNIPGNFPWSSRHYSLLSRSEDTMPRWMRDLAIRGGCAYDGDVASELRPSQFLYGPDANANYPRAPSESSQRTDRFGVSEPGWMMVGAAGLLYWYDALTKTSGGNGLVDTSAPEVTDFKLWGEVIVADLLKYGTARVIGSGSSTADTRRLIGLGLTYYDGQMLLSDSMRTYYPPGPVNSSGFPHPFLVETHPKFQYCVSFNGRAESSWHMGAVNWYRQNASLADSGALKPEAELWWNDMLGWVNTFNNGDGSTTKYRGWYAVFFNAIASLDLT